MPIEIFTQNVILNYSRQSDILRTIEKEPFYNCLKVRNIDITYVSNILRIFGYPDYTPNYLATVIENSVELDPDLVGLVWRIATKESLLQIMDLRIIDDLNSLNPSDRQLMKDTICRLANLTEMQKDYFKLLDKDLD